MSSKRARHNSILDSLVRLARHEEGATAVEYGVIATGIFLIALGAITLFAGNAVNMWNSIATHI
jgi:Flp pilus assembly pilin Flp